MRRPPPRSGWLVLAAAGLAWLAGAVATGQRYPGASFAWALPAALAFALALLGCAGIAGAARWARQSQPWKVAEGAARPLLLSWGVVLLLLLSDGANHYFANWARLRLATLVVVALLSGIATGMAALRLMEARSRALTRIVRRTGVPALVFAGALAVLLASAGGHLYTPDEWTIYGAAAGLIEHGIPAAYADQPYPLHLLGGVVPSVERESGRLERVYPKYGILPAVLAAPVYAVARITGPGPDLPQLPGGAFPFENRALPLVPLLVNPSLTAATAALLYSVASILGYDRRAALVAAGGYLFGSLAWPYSKTLLNMTPAGLALLGAFWCVLRARGPAGGSSSRIAWSSRLEAAGSGRGRRHGGGAPDRLSGEVGRATGGWIAGAGLCAGLAVATRYEALLFALPIAAWSGALGLRPVRALRGLALFGAGLGVAAVPLVMGINVLRTGSPLDAGYGAEGTLGSLLEKPWYGWFGIVLSPGCGLIPHTPLMALGVLAVAWLWEDDPAPALVCGAITLGAIAYYGSLSTTWCAFATWGPRYFVAVAPLMALPLASLWQRLPHQGRNPFVALMGGGLLLWSAGTNLLAVLVDFNRGWQDHWSQGVTYLETSWLPFFSGITAHVRLLRQWLLDGQGGLDLYLLYALGPVGVVVVAVLLAGGGALLATAWLATESDREVDTETNTETAVRSRPAAVRAAPIHSEVGR